jgi:tRNA(adenine34) deaminase
MTDDKYTFMREALKEAKKAALKGEIPVGAVIVKDGEIISRGHNTREYKNDASAHAEMTAIRRANKKLRSWRLDGCELYVTLEPCPMCAGAVIQARIKTLYFGAFDKKGGACGSITDLFDGFKWNHIPFIESGVLEDECSYILKDFFAKLREKKSK